MQHTSNSNDNPTVYRLFSFSFVSEGRGFESLLWLFVGHQVLELFTISFQECLMKCFPDKAGDSWQGGYPLMFCFRQPPLHLTLLHSQNILTHLSLSKGNRNSRIFSFSLKCENEGIMKAFWCMPTTVMSSSILLQACTKHSGQPIQIKVQRRLLSFIMISSEPVHVVLISLDHHHHHHGFQGHL